MPRIIFKCPYIKPGMQKVAAHLSNYVRYVATRDGVEKLTPDEAVLPATKKQQAMVERLLRDFPMSRGMFEYEDYLASPTRAAASEFITRAIEDNYDQITKRENYVSYIAQRPRAERIGTHGLFNGTGDTLELTKIAEEVAKHPGNVWLPIISLRREDAARLGYDRAKQWQSLLQGYAPQIAEAMKIPWDQFRWYAAFHDESYHPHVHMVCYSADGRSGFLWKDGIARIKSGLAKNIFRQELTEIYQEQTVRRDELIRKSSEAMGELIQQMRSGTLENPYIEQRMEYLSRRLKNTTGKKQYGYLKATLKAVVDEIVDELAKDARIAAAYDLWYQLREEVLRTYRNDLPERLPFSQQKEFKQIKNLVIKEAMRLSEYAEVVLPDDDIEPDDESFAAEPQKQFYAGYRMAKSILKNPSSNSEQTSHAAELLIQAAEAGIDCAQYTLGKLYQDGGPVERDTLRAMIWFSQAAEQGNSYAMYALGKLHWDAGNTAAALRWFQQSAEQGNQYAQHFLERMKSEPTLFTSATRLLHHMGNIFREQAPLPAGGVSFVDSKLRRKIREKKIAMGHKPDDHEEQVQKIL